MALETPFRRLHGSLVDLSAAGFDQGERFGRSLLPIWRHRKQYWTSQNVLHMEVAVKRFVSRELPNILDKHKQYSDRTVSLEVPLSGLRSVVRIVALGPLKAVLRAYPLSARYDADQHYRASTLLHKHGVRVPAIYHRTESPKKYGAIFLVEEFIEGCSKEPDDLTVGDISTAAAELARLHQVKSEVWGPITAPRTEDYGTVVMRRVERHLTSMSRGTSSRNQQDLIPQLRSWFNGWRDSLAEIREFALIHGKLHRENCLFETSGRFCLLDITTLEWGIASEDLVTVHFSQCGDQPELIAKFDAAYYAALPSEDADRSRSFIPFFTALHCISQIIKYRKRLSRGQKQHPGDAIKKEIHWWNRLRTIVEETGDLNR
jgi:aminoglycoside phosphotransferase (APT) family kinase protein